jgi:hypothetical protein
MGTMRKTHFEQVPLDVIQRVLEENARQEKIRTDRETHEEIKKNWETDVLETTTANGWSERL